MWYSGNREEGRRRKRVSMALKRAEDPDAVRRYQRDYHHNNRERRTKKMRDYCERRFFWARMNKLRPGDRPSHVQLARLWKKQRGRCAITGRRLTRENAELDHRHPKSKGGGDNIENLQWTCCEVNRAKRDLSQAEFEALCYNVLSWMGKTSR